MESIVIDITCSGIGAPITTATISIVDSGDLAIITDVTLSTLGDQNYRYIWNTSVGSLVVGIYDAVITVTDSDGHIGISDFKIRIE